MIYLVIIIALIMLVFIRIINFIKVELIYKKLKKINQKGRLAIITGSNVGIGFYTAEFLALN